MEDQKYCVINTTHKGELIIAEYYDREIAKSAIYRGKMYEITENIAGVRTLVEIFP